MADYIAPTASDVVIPSTSINWKLLSITEATLYYDTGGGTSSACPDSYSTVASLSNTQAPSTVYDTLIKHTASSEQAYQLVLHYQPKGRFRLLLDLAKWVDSSGYYAYIMLNIATKQPTYDGSTDLTGDLYNNIQCCNGNASVEWNNIIVDGYADDLYIYIGQIQSTAGSVTYIPEQTPEITLEPVVLVPE